MYTIVHDGEIVISGVEENKAKEIVREKSTEWGKVEIAFFSTKMKQWVPVSDPLQFANA